MTTVHGAKRDEIVDTSELCGEEFFVKHTRKLQELPWLRVHSKLDRHASMFGSMFG